ncbi:hypothetical protein ACTU44_21795 (plasmid) [Thalassospira sp. SM2505]
MRNYRLNSAQKYLIGGQFSHPDHMIQPLRKIYKKIGWGRANVKFLQDLLSGFCEVSCYKAGIGFGENETPKAMLVNSLIELQTGGLTGRSVQRHLAFLEKEGVIERDINNGYQRYIDLTPLVEKALEWKKIADQAFQEEQQKRAIIQRYRKLKHRASVLIQNSSSRRDIEPELNNLRRLSCAAGDNDKAKIALADHLETAIKVLVDKLAELDDLHSDIPTNLSSPPDEINTNNTTTHPLSGKKVDKKKGADALIDASHRASAGQKNSQKEERGFGTVQGVKPEKSWPLLLKIAPDMISSLKHSRDPVEQARHAAINFVPVRSDILEMAIMVHGSHTVLAAIALAMAKQDFVNNQGGDIRRARAAFAKGILSKNPPADGLPMQSTCNPWPSIWGHLRNQQALNGSFGTA